MQDWQKPLAAAGWPTELLILDYETFFDKDYSLTGTSVCEFVADPRFEETALGVWDSQEAFPRIETFDPTGGLFGPSYIPLLMYLQETYGEHLERVTVGAFNAMFDGLILLERHGVQPAYFLDLLSVARMMEAQAKRHDLGTVAAKYGLPAKGNTKDFEGVHAGDRTEELTAYLRRDLEIELALAKKLLPMVSRPEVELTLMHHTTCMYLNPTLRFDQKKAVELTKEMNGELAAKLKSVGHTAEELRGNQSFQDLLSEALPPGEELPLKVNKLGKPILALAKTDPELETFLVHPEPRVRALVEARQATKSWPLHIKRIGSMSRQAATSGDWLRVPLAFHGTHTGRWSGREKINLQNLASKGLPVVTAIRQTILAPPGYTLVVGDAASIEARGTDWLAGETSALESWARGEDRYCIFATEVFGVKVRPPRTDDPPPVAKRFKFQRTLGKIGVLGCGFGMGPTQCQTYARQQFQVIIDIDMAKKIVKGYRATHPMVTKLWKTLEGIVLFVLRYHEPMDGPMGTQAWSEGSTLHFRLPSGRVLTYPDAYIYERAWPDGRTSSAIGYKYGYLWGGSLTENIVQAMSRDVLAEALIDLEAQGIPIGLHVHDELVSAVPEEDAEWASKEMGRFLSKSPAWAPDWPLGAEVHTTAEYKKG